MIEIKAPNGRVIGLMEEGPLAELVKNLVGKWLTRDKRNAFVFLYRDEPREIDGTFFATSPPGVGSAIMAISASGVGLLNIKCDLGQKIHLI